MATLMTAHAAVAQSALARTAPAQPAQTAPAAQAGSPIAGASGASRAPQSLSAAAPSADIHDIRGPKPIPSPWLIPLIAVTALLAMGGTYAAWTWNRRRYRQASQRPLDIALDRLDRARRLMAPPRGREFSIEVSSAVRDYIEGRFDIRAAHLTTDEFLHQLLEPAESLLSAHRSELDHFLQTCDLAKFGGWNLAAADMQAMLESARRFIVAAADETHSAPQGAPSAPQGAPSSTSIPASPAPLASTAPANVAGDRSIASHSRETYVSLPSALLALAPPVAAARLDLARAQGTGGGD